MLFITEKGKGDPLLLIHGFPMHSEVWDEFSALLSNHFRVLLVDLPGFGKSPSLHDNFTIDQVARVVLDTLEPLISDRVVVVGHSLGGYVALSMAAQRPDLFAGLCLYHSTAYPDSPEKKESRSKVIEFIQKNGVEAFTSNFIAPLFADQQHSGIARVRKLNMESKQQSVMGYIQAMRDRPDFTSVLKIFSNPVLLLTGDKDPGIPLKTIVDQALLNTHIEVQILHGQAHMSMIEEQDKAASAVRFFSQACFLSVK